MQQMEITRPWIILNCKNNAMSKKLETHTQTLPPMQHTTYTVYIALEVKPAKWKNATLEPP